MRSAFVAAALVVASLGMRVQTQDAYTPDTDNGIASRHYTSGWRLLVAEQWPEAAREFQAAVELDDDFKLAHYGLGRANMGRKRFDEAIRAYERCRCLYEEVAARTIANQPQSANTAARDFTAPSVARAVPAFVWLALGSAYLRAERFAEAERAYRQSLAADPKLGEAQSNLAALYLIIGRFEDASRALEAAEKSGFHVHPGLKREIEAKRWRGR